MSKRPIQITLAAMGVLLALAGAARAQTAPYDERLNRLAEVLGSIHYLQNLCTATSNRWREEMNQLLAVEKPEPARRARLIASFNRGYRAFDSVYVQCTAQARASADRYVKEGIRLAAEIENRYAE